MKKLIITLFFAAALVIGVAVILVSISDPNVPYVSVKFPLKHFKPCDTCNQILKKTQDGKEK